MIFKKVTATRFDRVEKSGRTQPCVMACVDEDGLEHELIVKLAAGCETKHRALANEAISACFAKDLGLPIPDSFLVKIDAEFARSIPNDEARTRALGSVGWNFGSSKLPDGFSLYPVGAPLPRSILGTAADIVAFDVFIENPDRRVSKPNILWNGRELWIFDHEQAFLFNLLLFWRPFWEKTALSLSASRPDDRHLFLDLLRGKELDFDRIQGALEAIPTERFQEYAYSLPDEWMSEPVQMIPAYLETLKANAMRAINLIGGALR